MDTSAGGSAAAPAAALTPATAVAKPDAAMLSPERPNSSLSKRESLKVQKKVYKNEKKRATKELLSTLRDPSVILLADYLKVRGSLKGWTRLWCVLKPGMLVLYKSQKQKSGHWVGTVLLNACELIERPSKKDGFCFKVFHPLEQSIWATRGPDGETLGAFIQPLPYSCLIFRAPSEAAGKTWMDALELALRCSSLLLRSLNKDRDGSGSTAAATAAVGSSPSGTGLAAGGGGGGGVTASGEMAENGSLMSSSFPAAENGGTGSGADLDESDREKHFGDLRDCGQAGDKTHSNSESPTDSSDSDDASHRSGGRSGQVALHATQPVETPYVENAPDEISGMGDTLQEEFADENKSIIWHLMKQVRPGMDLSRVVLPTFILEPRSLLEKFADYYYHSNLITEATQKEDAFSRMKAVVRWYISGFYKKPQGVKKPYNPILGECFRCYWKDPDTGSRTFYVAEQLSHHPPVTAFYVTNRQDGFSINCSVLAKSKFYGNSVSAVFDGAAKLTLLKRGEDYRLTMPYGHAKGIIVGQMTMELGGKVSIDCEKTGYKAELDFKLKPFIGGDGSNRLAGKIRLGSKVLATIDGRWDSEVWLRDADSGEAELLWKVTPEVIGKRLRRYTIPLDSQEEYESEKLWIRVADALRASNQERATAEKFFLEDQQRKATKERKLAHIEWTPRLFERDAITGDWIYKYSDLRPWDPVNDIMQFEHDFNIQTRMRHETPLVRQMSVVNVGQPMQPQTDHVLSNGTASAGNNGPRRRRRMRRASDSSTASHSSADKDHPSTGRSSKMGLPAAAASAVADGVSSSLATVAALQAALEPLVALQRDSNERLQRLQSTVIALAASRRDESAAAAGGWGLATWSARTASHWIVLAVALLVVHVLLQKLGW